MTPEEFRKAAHEMVDIIADYRETIESRRVLSDVSPGYLAPLVSNECPEEPESWDAVRNDIERVIMPGVTHWQHPNFFAFFPAVGSPEALLGDMLSGAINCIGFNWLNSPACTELETVVMDWLARLCGLPDHFLSNSPNGGGGVIQGTASEATLVALIAAREKEMRRRGCPPSTEDDASKLSEGRADANAASFVVYGSTQTHSSIKKAAMILGCAHREVPCDRGNGAMDAGKLGEMVRADAAAGLIPFAVVATLGTTSTCAMDPLEDIGAVCAEHGLWYHVDAAYAGAAMVCPEYRDFARGLELADSYVFNCHKWLLVNFDLSAFWVRDRKQLIDALSITPAYMRNAASESGLVLDYRDWQVPLGRRFRSLKLWFALRMRGATGARDLIRRHVALASTFEGKIRADDRFELPVPPKLSLVCFRMKVPAAKDDEERRNAANAALVERVNAAGKIFIIGTMFEGMKITRFVPVADTVEEKHVLDAWDHIQEIAQEILAEDERDGGLAPAEGK